jgi:TctA family transporter
MVLAFVTVSAAFGDSHAARADLAVHRPALGLIGIDGLTGQARLTFGVPHLMDGIEITTLAVALFAIGEALFVAAQGHAAGRTKVSRSRVGLDDARGLEAVVEALAARHGHRLSHRRDAGGRRRDRHLPVLCGRKS